MFSIYLINILYLSASSGICFICSVISSTRLKSFNIFSKSSKLGNEPSCNLGYISFNKIERFSNICIAAFSLNAKLKSGLFVANNPFNTEEIAIPVFIGSLYINGFNPTESELLGSIIFTGKLKFLQLLP